MRTVTVAETFTSIQGESTYSGLTCFFIRLAGCNLRCCYCDTKQAWAGGLEVGIDDLVKEACASAAAIIEITGGEPLFQPGFAELALELKKKAGRPVLVETNGSLDISAIPEGVVAIMDVKCPGSGEDSSLDPANLCRLRSYDEVKFVISDKKDYDWACEMVHKHPALARDRVVLFSAVAGLLEPGVLGGWIIRDGLDVRLQVQLHKILNMK